ncbi:MULTISPECIES: hypothetical protein [Pseudomonadota]|uniref:hypothetical protein n=1 Tax=Pseudomonadota TaxID=1224 RepID=UPI002AFEC1FF|nr:MULTISPECIES: hypothetical protein [Pseudomonadota]
MAAFAVAGVIDAALRAQLGKIVDGSRLLMINIGLSMLRQRGHRVNTRCGLRVKLSSAEIWMILDIYYLDNK